MENRMFRFIGQVLAMIAVMASGLNAQCALSCVLEQVQASSSHDCCPEQNGPAKHDEHRQQCSVLVMAPSTLAAVNLVQYSSVPLAFSAPPVLLVDGHLPVRQHAAPLFVGSSGIPDVPAFAILRI
jgi:hypothetical protein